MCGGVTLKKKKRYGIFRAAGSPPSAYRWPLPGAPRELCWPLSLGHTGRQEGISFQVPNAFLVGGLPWGGWGAMGPEVHAASRRATREPAQDIPIVWALAHRADSQPGRLHRAPRHRHRTQTPGEVVKWLQRLVVGGPGHGLGRGPAQSISQWGGSVAPVCRAPQLPEPSSPLAQALRAHFPGRATSGRGRGGVLPALHCHPAGRGSPPRLTCPGGYTKGHG